MQTLKLKRRLVFLGMFAAVFLALTPFATVHGGEPGTGCGDLEDVKWNGPPLSGTMEATRNPADDLAIAHFEVANQNCDLEFDFEFTWPTDQYCFDPEEEICIPGFDGLAAHDIRMMCFPVLIPPAVLIPPGCLFSEDPWVQIIAADNLVYSNSDNTFEVNVRMMEVVPR